ncbi:hypothetical protein P4H42_04925 [Paenibacillus macerans]|nr:hypothetical protein [Paenibacillus macerans]MEC0328965.1 hypothetical protein [Paenibacillus macerans]
MPNGACDLHNLGAGLAREELGLGELGLGELGLGELGLGELGLGELGLGGSRLPSADAGLP